MTRIEEQEANQFAMELLMPEHMVRTEVAKMKGVDLANDKALRKLADIFQVPQAAMAIRLSQIFNSDKLG